jgi:hypothetical protein
MLNSRRRIALQLGPEFLDTTPAVHNSQKDRTSPPEQVVIRGKLLRKVVAEKPKNLVACSGSEL